MVVKRHTGEYSSSKAGFKTLLWVVAVCLIVLVFEMFIFNFRHFESLTFSSGTKEIKFSPIETSKLTDEYQLEDIDQEKKYIISEEFNCKIYNISLEKLPLHSYFKLDGLKPADHTDVETWLRDDGFNLFIKLPPPPRC